MCTRHSGAQQVKEAKQIAKDHGMFVVEKGGKYFVYRCLPDHRNTFLGSRGTPESLRQFVARCAGFH